MTTRMQCRVWIATDDATRAVAKVIAFYCAKPGLPDVDAWAYDIAMQCLEAACGAPHRCDGHGEHDEQDKTDEARP